MAVAWRQGASVRGSAGVGLRGRSAAARSSRGARASRARGAVAGAKVDPKDQWYAKGGEVANLRGVVSTPEFLQVLAENTDRLVVVDFYAKWCGACKALYPKILQLAERNPDILFVKVDFDDNRKSACGGAAAAPPPAAAQRRGARGPWAAARSGTPAAPPPAIQ